jgi:rubrerythrin
MIDLPDVASICNTAEFYAQALAIEIEASDRYKLLAEQMEVHNNAEVADIFHRMAALEIQHHDEILARTGDLLLGGKKAQFSWILPDGPEVTEFDKVHYLMSPYQALEIAKRNEERAAIWFEAIAKHTADPEIRRVAEQLASEEREHVSWVENWMKRYPPAEPGWDEDWDRPIYSE